MPKMLLTITGPSGSGKTSILRELTKTYGVSRIVTCTTRHPRLGERNGVDYHFLTEEQFQGRMMVAPALFAGNHYGINIGDIHKQFQDHDILAIIVEPSGAEALKERFVSVHNIYINIDPKMAVAYMARRDGWAKAKKRQKADVEGGLYYDKLFEAAEKYDCIIRNDKSNNVRNMARDIMNYAEAQKWLWEMKGKNVA